MYGAEILHRPSVSSLIHIISIQIHRNHADITKHICYFLLFKERAAVCEYGRYYKYI